MYIYIYICIHIYIFVSKDIFVCSYAYIIYMYTYTYINPESTYAYMHMCVNRGIYVNMIFFLLNRVGKVRSDLSCKRLSRAIIIYIQYIHVYI